MSAQMDFPEEAIGGKHLLRENLSSSSGIMELSFGVVASFLIWTNLYFITHALNKGQSAEWNCRLITVLHALLATSMCLFSALVVGPWPFGPVGMPSTAFHNFIIFVSLGYFLFDFAWCIYMMTEGPVMLAHHLVSVLGLSVILYHGRYGCEITSVLGASELTNPLLQYRWFLKKTGNYMGMKAIVVDWTFFLLFWLARLVVGTVYHYHVQTTPNLDWVVYLGGNAFYAISVIFGIQLLLFINRKYIKKAPGKED